MNKSETSLTSYKQLGFLFLFFYFFLYGTSSLYYVYYFLDQQVWQKVVPWFAKAVGYATPMTINPKGNSDFIYSYFQIIFFFVLAMLLAIVTFFLLKRKLYPILSKCLTVFLRYYVAFQMFFYGFAKVYYLQFETISDYRLDQPLGEFTPMALLWTFMGYSKGYTMFTGLIEVIGGLLLLSKRTTTLGAITVFGVMLNVMLLNFFYDIPVKILSSHIVFMCTYLILKDKDRLLRFFVLNQGVEPQKNKALLLPRFAKSKTVVKTLIIVSILLYSNYEMYDIKSDMESAMMGNPFSGKNSIEDFRLSTLFGLVDSTAEKWQSIYHTRPNFAILTKENDSDLQLNFEVDTINKQIRFKEIDEHYYYSMQYQELDSGRYHLYGIYLQDSINIILKSNVHKEYPLINKEFSWINDASIRW